MMNGIYEYSPPAEVEMPDGEIEPQVKRKRGVGFSWYPLQLHQNLQLARDSVDPVMRTKGRVHRGVTSAFYFHCSFRGCGCEKQWRMVTSLISLEVWEEETVGVHTNHDLLQRNGGRGLSFEQVAILEECASLKISMKPLLLLNIFRAKANALLLIGSIDKIIIFDVIHN